MYAEVGSAHYARRTGAWARWTAFSLLRISARRIYPVSTQLGVVPVSFRQCGTMSDPSATRCDKAVRGPWQMLTDDRDPPKLSHL